MKRVCVVAMCGLSLLVSVGLRAQDEKPAAIDPNQVNADAEVGAPSGGKMVEQALLDYAVAKKITYGAAVDGRIFYQAKANVEVDETNAQWGKARTLAFEKAVGKAEAQFARDQYGKQFVETVRELFDNQSDKADEFPEEAPTDSRLQALFDKIVALKDAELDEKLEKLGIDPKEFSAKPAPQKLTQFRQAMTKRMATRAIGETAGMMIVQTFEGAAEDGTRAVGVVLCYSPKLRQLAYDIAKGRAPLLTGTPKKALAEHIPTDP